MRYFSPFTVFFYYLNVIFVFSFSFSKYFFTCLFLFFILFFILFIFFQCTFISVFLSREECFNINIPPGDPHFSETCMPLVRSLEAIASNCVPGA